MKKILFAIFGTAAILCGSFKAGAQTPVSGYFLDNYVYGYRLNPVLFAEKSFFAAGCGSIDMNLQSDLGLSSLLFPAENGKLVTGLNNSVSSEQFLSGIQDANSLNLGLNYNVLALGIRDGIGQVTVEVNVRPDITASLPGDLFRFLKDGTSSGSLDLSNLHAGIGATAELAVGYARIVNKQWAFGFRLKALAGAADANLNIQKGMLNINGEELSADVDAALRIACAPLSVTPSGDAENKVIDFGGFAFDGPINVAGFGGAVDLGVAYTPVKALNITVGVSDLGFMKWNYNEVQSASGAYAFKGFEGVDVTAEKPFDGILDEVADGFTNAFKFKHVQSAENSETTMLSTKINAGVKYHIVPQVAAGVFYQQYLNRYNGWYDVRGGLTLTPFKQFSLSANYGISSFGPTLGAGLSLNLLGINIHAVVDGYSGPLAEMNIPGVGEMPVIPVNPFKLSASLGVTFQLLGRRHLSYMRLE